MVRMIVPVSAELLERVREHQHENRMASRSEAVRDLLESALDAAEREAARKAYGGGKVER